MPLPVLGKIALGMTVATCVALKDGIIEINVHEKHGGRDHIHLYVPATVATWGVHMVPEAKIREHLRRNRDHLQIALVALHELEKLPDAELVDVESPREHAHVAIRGGSFVVDVDDPGETVHVSVPIRAARKVLEDLQYDATPSGT